MVTGQTTTGTGVLTEFTSSFTDFFGVQSGRHNKKLKDGEDMCKVQLRTQTLNMGGNAVDVVGPKRLVVAEEGGEKQQVHYVHRKRDYVLCLGSVERLFAGRHLKSECIDA